MAMAFLILPTPSSVSENEIDRWSTVMENVILHTVIRYTFVLHILLIEPAVNAVWWTQSIS